MERENPVKMSVQNPGAAKLSQAHVTQVRRNQNGEFSVRWPLLIILLSYSSPLVHHGVDVAQGFVTPVSGLDLFSSFPSPSSSAFFKSRDTPGKQETHHQSSFLPASWWSKNQPSKTPPESEPSVFGVPFRWTFSSSSAKRKGPAKTDEREATTTGAQAVKHLARPGEVLTAPRHLPRTVGDIPKTPADFFIAVAKTDGTAGRNAESACLVEPSTFPRDARTFVVQCPSGVSAAELLLLTRNPKRKFRRPGKRRICTKEKKS